jgi:hypothetical protein
MVIKTEKAHAIPRIHAWEMIAAFALVLPEERSENKCMLKPVAASLEPLGIDAELLRRVCADVEQAGEALRGSCPGQQPGAINVRVHVSSQAMRAPAAKPWDYYIVPQIASSESDSLDALENPRCFIDVHLYQ